MDQIVLDLTQGTTETLPNVRYDAILPPPPNGTRIRSDDPIQSRFHAQTLKEPVAYGLGFVADFSSALADQLTRFLRELTDSELKGDTTPDPSSTALAESGRGGRRISRREARRLALKALEDAERERKEDRLREARTFTSAWEGDETEGLEQK